MRQGRLSREAKWLANHGPLDMEQHGDDLLQIILKIQAADHVTPKTLRRILARHPKEGVKDTRTMFSKHELVRGYRILCESGHLVFDRATLRRLQMKPTRTLSGVAPVTVLTKPFPCPGQCVFCPTDVQMPKSYLADEPGAMRAAYHDFDPFEQTAARIRALENIGHTTDKIELLILGGTWSAYPADYQKWFIGRCLDAMNTSDASSLREAQSWNETAPHRNVGLVIETRPDCLTPDEIVHLRRLGVTKVQIGAQSLDDGILDLNRRNHTVEQTRQAARLLRLAGFKIAIHWMPNLLGATQDGDRKDFRRLWDDLALRPDELKIYPCTLVANTGLYMEWQRGVYQPYTEETLIRLVSDCKAIIPPYCRVNRVARDIPAPNIVSGSRRANLRQLIHLHMLEQEQTCRCIRCREVRHERLDANRTRWERMAYDTDVTTEYFLSALTHNGRLAGFLRLSLPKRGSPVGLEMIRRLPAVFDEIGKCGMIRQLHVYGPALAVGSDSSGEAQHSGVGRQLIRHAQQITRARGYQKLAVIAATGTREYYRRAGFELGELYMTMNV